MITMMDHMYQKSKIWLRKMSLLSVISKINFSKIRVLKWYIDGIHWIRTRAQVSKIV